MTELPTVEDDYLAGRCGSCRFWAVHPLDHEIGFCERFPPVLSETAATFFLKNRIMAGEQVSDDVDDESLMLQLLRGQDVWYSPVTCDTETCGEWQVKK